MSQIEITPALLSDLRQKAEAATPGPWISLGIQFWGPHTLGGCNWGERGSQRNKIGITYQGESEPDEECQFVITNEQATANAAHIAAASPAVVLALMAEVERLRDRLDELICSECNQQPKFCVCDVQLEASDADQA